MTFIRAAIVLILYTIAYAFIVFASLADGHGTFLFAATLIAWPLYAMGFMLLPLANRTTPSNIAIICVIVYYIATAALVTIEQSGEGNFQRTINLAKEQPYVFVFGGIWFLGMQLMFWSLLNRSRNRTKDVV